MANQNMRIVNQQQESLSNQESEALASQALLVAAPSNDSTVIDSSSIPDGAIDISNMTAEQLQALGISFVDADEYATLMASQPRQQSTDITHQTQHELQSLLQGCQPVGFEGLLQV